MASSKKAHRFVDMKYLEWRKNSTINAGYAVSKWMWFCEWALSNGLHVFLHESYSTVSKYIYVSKSRNGPQFKVRFSNHKPNATKERAEDCDFFVGISNQRTTTTEDAISAVEDWCLQTPLQRALCTAVDRDNAVLDRAWGDGEDYLHDGKGVI
jgi:hypothetical protein